MTQPSSSLRWQILFPALLLLVLTLWFRWTDEDIGLIHSMRTKTGIAGWQDADSGIWGWLKNYGVIPAFLMVLVALAGVGAAAFCQKHAHWMRPSLYLILVIAIGGGLISNLILKDHWGRPRPNHVVELGGNEKFVKVLTPNFGSDGKSFPCGHATTGYFFFAVGLLFRNRRPLLARIAILWALVLGTMLGISRMLQGGHFASDILWAAGIMWFTALGLLYALKLQHFMEEPIVKHRISSKKARWIGIALGGGTFILFAVGMVSIPRNRVQTLYVAPAEKGQVQSFDLDFAGNLTLVSSRIPEFEAAFDGCGTPKSRAWIEFDPTRDGYKGVERNSGFFTEKNLNVKLSLRPGDYLIRISPSVRKLTIPPPMESSRRADGTISVHIP